MSTRPLVKEGKQDDPLARRHAEASSPLTEGTLVARQHTLTNRRGEQVPRTSAGGRRAAVGTGITSIGQRGLFLSASPSHAEKQVLRKFHSDDNLRPGSTLTRELHRAAKGHKEAETPPRPNVIMCEDRRSDSWSIKAHQK